MRPDILPPTDDLPLVTKISSERPLAARSHICTSCGLPIAIGERYERIVIRLDDALDPRKALRTLKLHVPMCPEGEHK